MQSYKSLNNINQIKSELFGKTGKISNEFKKMGSMSSDIVEKNLHLILTQLKTNFRNLLRKKSKILK